MPYMNPNYRVASHSRVNDGTSSDLSQLLAQKPGWLLSVEAWSLSTVAPAYLFIYDSSVAVTTASIPIWQGIVPIAVSASTALLGAGFVADLANRTLNNGLAYALSSNAAFASLSTAPASFAKVNIAFQTSSCL